MLRREICIGSEEGLVLGLKLWLKVVVLRREIRIGSEDNGPTRNQTTDEQMSEDCKDKGREPSYRRNNMGRSTNTKYEEKRPKSRLNSVFMWEKGRLAGFGYVLTEGG